MIINFSTGTAANTLTSGLFIAAYAFSNILVGGLFTIYGFKIVYQLKKGNEIRASTKEDEYVYKVHCIDSDFCKRLLFSSFDQMTICISFN